MLEQLHELACVTWVATFMFVCVVGVDEYLEHNLSKY